jgi:hypothetical protein
MINFECESFLLENTENCETTEKLEYSNRESKTERY